MGRPYEKEMAALPETMAWARSVNIEALCVLIGRLAERPLLIVGSGGSATGGHLIARLQEFYARQPVRVVTPYEFTLLPADEMSSVLLLSAGGSNPDILAAADHAVAVEYPVVAAIVAKSFSPVAKRIGDCRFGLHFGFDVPTGKDGFLATNSLLATALLVSRAYTRAFGSPFDPEPATIAADDIVLEPDATGGVFDRALLTVLGGGWAWPAAIDLESKCNEAGLGVVTCADYRNFAHGRHHGLAQRASASGVVALITPDCEKLAERTLALLPRTIPVHRIATADPGPRGAIELLLRVFRFVGDAGVRAGIDPGRPRVAAFGRRLYRLGIPRRAAITRRELIDLWIRRKLTAPVWAGATKADRVRWRGAYEAWADRQETVRVDGVVFDYDGTICEAEERYGTPSPKMGAELAALLDRGVAVGVATGRGDSVLDALRAVVPKTHHERVIVGLYNGGVLTRLSEPISNESEPEHVLQDAEVLLRSSAVIEPLVTTRVRPTQLTLRARRPMPKGLLCRMVLESLAICPNVVAALSIHESGHTIDIVPRAVSKLRVLDHVTSLLASERARGLSDRSAVLTIGDQGLLTGNDFAFLSRLHGLSVERVSTPLDRCWNLTAPGRRGSAALLDYLAVLRETPDGPRFAVRDMERVRRP